MYLNPELNKEQIKSIFRFICDKKNNFITFDVPERVFNDILDDVFMQDLDRPPNNKIRKIIFKDSCCLTTSEKLKIVGSIIGRKKISESEIYDAMLYTSSDSEKITIEKLAKHLDCSTRTVYRNMSEDLKKEKEILNQELCGTS